MKALTVRLPKELHKKFKILAIESGQDMQSILIEYIESLLTEDED